VVDSEIGRFERGELDHLMLKNKFHELIRKHEDMQQEHERELKRE
jgi:hypothetical protein